ncbi:hydantoinase B/oxoprolinase family protein [Marinibaculum pumilum]|uniref:Hydantoinase B/oxoprolinase family protein n=1 Tax=Marinibaculum pumilum TaxID=1766165 RepID=A0ABV7L556_9PROT
MTDSIPQEDGLSTVDRAVIIQALVAATREMGAKLIRSAHSPIVREAADCSAALLDPAGNVVAQAELIPMQLGSISHTFGPCAAATPPEELVEGDFYISNDPYHGGQHVPDIFLFTPIFLDGILIGFSATVAHHIDLGGGKPGLNPEASDVHQEGIIFPPSRYNLARDWQGGPLERFIRANVRMPDATIGDLDAQFAANAIGATRLTELCRKHGPAKVQAAMSEVLDYSERRIRAAIAACPDGVYVGEDAMDDDGLGSGPVKVRATVTVSGSDVAIDFAGSSDQVKSNMNSPFASTVAAAVSCVKSVMTSADIPYNSGAVRPITVTAPYGSLLNPKPPAPVRARLLPTYRVFDAVMRALAQALPEKVIASGYDTTIASCLSHLGPEGYSIYLEIFGGGYGAGPHNDGCDAVDSPLSNCSNIPVESLDMTYPFFRVAEYALVPGSAGSGRHRGGLGFRRTYEILDEEVTFATYGDRFRLPPEGLFGGAPGACAQTLVERGNERIPLASKQSFALRAGDRLVMTTGGGAGYGPPQDRPPALAEADRADGFTAPEVPA